MKEKIITKKILKWYDLNKRPLPWRKKVSVEKKQYYTLISEFMLQQTQVITVIPFFNRFIKNLSSKFGRGFLVSSLLLKTIKTVSNYLLHQCLTLWHACRGGNKNRLLPIQTLIIMYKRVKK